MTLLRHLAVAAVAGVALFLATYQLDPFRNYQLATAAAYLCAVAGLTVLVGQSGQLSLGHGALMAVGAYTVALLQNAYGTTGPWMLAVSLAAGALATTLVGAVIGLAAARLRGPYLAGASALTGRTQLWPLWCLGRRPSQLASPLGYPPDMRFIRLDYYNPKDILTLGTEKWKVFPVIRKNGALGEPNSGLYGYAYRINS